MAPKVTWKEWWGAYREFRDLSKLYISRGVVKDIKFKILPYKVKDEEGQWVISVDLFVVPQKPIEHITLKSEDIE